MVQQNSSLAEISPPGFVLFLYRYADSGADHSVVLSIVSSIDLNSLDSLARTSFYIHNALIQYRQTLLRSTLHCTNEHVPVDRDETLRYRARAINLFYMDDSRNCNGKSGDCARDLVGPCRRCGDVVCRVR